MGQLNGKVALVTGASRGVGKGIALELGAARATVYLTGRTSSPENATVPLPGTLTETAEQVTQAGGTGIALRCDHGDDAQVAAVFERIKEEQGRLDILVNNVWGGYEGYHADTYPPPDVPFWERPISFWDENLRGVRWTYVSTWHAVPLLIAAGHGLIVNISFGVPLGNAAYNVAKTATDRLAAEFAHGLREHGIAAVALYPGLVRTEGVLKQAQWFDMSNSESPQYTGRAVVALAIDANRMEKSGQALVTARLAQEYDFDDIDGKRPTPIH